MRLMRRRIMKAKACAHQRAKSCEATLCFCDRKHDFYYIKYENDYLKNDKLQWRKL